MLLQSLIPASLLLLRSFATALPSDLLDRRQTTPADGCPTADGVHVIAVSGAMVPYDGPGSYGLIGNLSTSILNAIPGSTSVQVPYVKNYTNGYIPTTQGTVTFEQYVDQYHASCPCAQVVVIGYSSGAIITMNAVCGASAPWTTPAAGFNSSYADFIIGIISYGDETRVASAPYNLGTCTGSGTFPRTAANGACPLFADRIQSYCDIGDPDCCSGNVLSTHFIYDAKYDGESTQFVVEKHAAFGSICAGNGTVAATNISTVSASSSAASSASSSSSVSVALGASSSVASTVSSSSVAVVGATTSTAAAFTPTSSSVAGKSTMVSASMTSAASAASSAAAAATTSTAKTSKSAVSASVSQGLVTLCILVAMGVLSFLA